MNLIGKRYFIIHKPVGVLASRVDSSITNVVAKEHDPLFGQQRGGPSRSTIYDTAEAAGFPTDCGLVGRLDCKTSGVMLYTDDAVLGRAVSDPAEGEEQYDNVYKVRSCYCSCSYHHH